MAIAIDMTVITWGLIVSMLLLIGYFHGPSYSQQTVRSAPSILTSFGIFGTFLGIALGLMRFDSADIEASVPVMIDGLGVAVWSSIVGILGALSIRLRHSLQMIRGEAAQQSRQATVTDLHEAIMSLSAGLEQQRGENRDDAAKLLQSTRDYQQHMVNANTDALTTAMATVMRDFNSRIEVQYGENFQKFNAALGQLLQWQQSYSAQLEAMQESQQTSLKVIAHASQSYEQMLTHSQEFNRVAASLGELLRGLEQQTSNLEGYLSGLSGLVGQASEGLPALADYVTALTDKLGASIEQNNTSLTQVLAQAAQDISATVSEVTAGLAASVNEAHSGLATHVEAMTNKTDAHMQLLDKSMEKELTQALQTFGYQLTALSEKFVNDYMPLTDRLREVLALAELQTGKHPQATK